MYFSLSTSHMIHNIFFSASRYYNMLLKSTLYGLQTQPGVQLPQLGCVFHFHMTKASCLTSFFVSAVSASSITHEAHFCHLSLFVLAWFLSGFHSATHLGQIWCVLLVGLFQLMNIFPLCEGVEPSWQEGVVFRQKMTIDGETVRSQPLLLCPSKAFCFWIWKDHSNQSHFQWPTKTNCDSWEKKREPEKVA